VGNYEHLKTEHAGSASNWLDQIKPPVLDGEFARNLSPLYFQSPQCQAISRPPNVVRRSDHHVFVGRPDDTDRAGDELSVTDAALSRCVCEVFHGLECTNKWLPDTYRFPPFGEGNSNRRQSLGEPVIFSGCALIPPSVHDIISRIQSAFSTSD
jgi:hypothetical protein